jgi:hypothetical protein
MGEWMYKRIYERTENVKVLNVQAMVFCDVNVM